MRHLLLTAGLIGVSAITACSRNDSAGNARSRSDGNNAYTADASGNGTNGANGNNAHSAGVYDASGKASDAEALAALVAINDNEIDAAAVATGKRLAPAVLDYARMLGSEHSENKVKCMRLASDTGAGVAATAKSRMLREKGAKTLATLKPKEGGEFEQAFLADMVKGHEEALALIDNELLPNAQSSAVRAHLTATKSSVTRHRDMAKSLQGGMLMMTR
jgi:putative membrane protein